MEDATVAAQSHTKGGMAISLPTPACLPIRGALVAHFLVTGVECWFTSSYLLTAFMGTIARTSVRMHPSTDFRTDCRRFPNLTHHCLRFARYDDQPLHNLEENVRGQGILLSP
jgi:hypothetical protein